MGSADRTVDVLELLGRQERPLPATTIARRCALPRSTAYHLLGALRERSFVAYDEASRGWAIGAAVRELGSGAPTIGDAALVLEAFEAGAARVDPPAVARRTGLPVGAVRRTLDALDAEGLVRAHEDGAYSLGLRLVGLAPRTGSLEQLRLAARPALEQLRDATQETANLLLRDGGTALYVEQLESPHALRHAGWAGRAVPLSRSAAGAALRGAGGVHVVADAVEAGVTAVASRVATPFEHAAAVSVTGPSSRLAAHEAAVGAAVVAAARAVGAALATVGPEAAAA